MPRKCCCWPSRRRSGPLSEVKGLVADVVQANVDIAPLIDAALGAVTQYVVLASDQQFFPFLEREEHRLQAQCWFRPARC